MIDKGKVIAFGRVKEIAPATDVQEMLSDAISESGFTSAVILLQDGDGFWHFRCTGGIDKVLLIGMLDFIKMDLFHSMGNG